jgi:hypothetical protein
VNTGAPLPDLDEAEWRVLKMQLKLHQWANQWPILPVASMICSTSCTTAVNAECRREVVGFDIVTTEDTALVARGSAASSP